MIHHLLFTGHMIDKHDRISPRFSAAKEAAASEAIRDLLIKEKERLNGKAFLKALAGGACGGDILFHEICEELGIPSEIYLTYVPEKFKQTSVSFAGDHWSERFDRLLQVRPFHLLPPEYRREDQNIWEATNDWMLETALQNGGSNMSLVTLWDGERKYEKGGTGHMVQLAESQGATVKIAYTGDL